MNHIKLCGCTVPILSWGEIYRPSLSNNPHSIYLLLFYFKILHLTRNRWILVFERLTFDINYLLFGRRGIFTIWKFYYLYASFAISKCSCIRYVTCDVLRKGSGQSWHMCQILFLWGEKVIAKKQELLNFLRTCIYSS